MILLVRMIYTHGVLISCNIVPEYQVNLETVTLLAGNRSNGVMRYSVCLGKYESCLICICSP